MEPKAATLTLAGLVGDYITDREEDKALAPKTVSGVRVTQCWALCTAEAVYTELLRGGIDNRREGACGSVNWSPPGRSVTVEWELRANAVWRFGRLFLRCPRCERRATRIYLPTPEAWPACRRCWGLTYESRQLRNYHGDSSWAWAGWAAFHARENRAVAAAKRYAERRAILQG
jgi:hypothetical protein